MVSDYWIFKINFIISLIFLWVTPVFLIFWLVLFTIGLGYFKVLNWKSFIRTWSPIFSVWYLILLVNLIKFSPVFIGPGYTEDLMQKALINGVFFERICFSTIITLHAISTTIGIPILIPMFNIFSNKAKPTACEGEDHKKTNSTTTEPKKKEDGWFGKTTNQKDAERCSKLADEMSKVEYRAPLYQSKEMDSEDGTRTTRNISSRIPGYGVFNFCFSYPKEALKKKDK